MMDIKFPLRQVGDGEIAEANGLEFCTVYGASDHDAWERAIFIIRACNAHAALLEACKALMDWIGPPPADPQSYDSAREDAWKKAQAAIAQAEC